MKQKSFFRLLFFLWVVVGTNAWSQVTVSYPTSSNYPINQAISAIVPTQQNGTINGGTYREVSLFAGTGSSGGSNSSVATNASFQTPRGIAKDALGNYYIAEYDGKRIRKIASDGTVSTIYQFTDFQPRDLAINSANGDLYAIIATHRLIRLPNTNAVNYPAQNPVYTYTNDATNVVAGANSTGNSDATGTSARFNNPWGIAMAPDNSYLIVSDFGNNRLRKVMLSNFAVTSLLSAASFSGPTDVHIVNDDLIYVAEYSANRIRKISGGTTVTLLAGGTFTAGNFDGTGAAGFIDQPHSLTVDGIGNVYVVETNNHKIRKITPEGKVSTLAGNLWDNTGSGNQLGVGSNSRFKSPRGILYDIEGGFLLIADTDNHQLKKVQLEGFEILPSLSDGLSFNTATGVISGTPTINSLRNVYQNNFNSSQLEFLASESVTLVDNASVIGDYLMLTRRENNSKGGITIVPASPVNENTLKVSFDLITTKSSSDASAADGISYSFAPDANASSTSPTAEVGTGTKLTLSFANYSLSGTGNRGVRIFYNPASNQSLGTSVNSVLLAYSNNTSWMGKSVKVVLQVNQSGLLTLTIDGVTIFNNIQLPSDYTNADKSTWKHVIKARTGMSNDLHAIDNLSIQQGNGPTNHTIVARNYDGEQSIATAINAYELPTVTTQNVSGVQAYQATVAFQVVATGTSAIQESGVVFSTNAMPTVADTKIINSTNVIGIYSLDITGLSHGTTYYVRAYATNEFGFTVYGEPVSFTTLTTPTVATTSITSITQTSATSGGNVSSDGGLSLIEKGICWSTTANPTIDDNKEASNSTATGSFVSELTNLNSGTVYYVRAYATNSVGTTYGSQQIFTTISAPPTISYVDTISLTQNVSTTVSPIITGGTPTEGLGGVPVDFSILDVPFPFVPIFASSSDTSSSYYTTSNRIFKIDASTGVSTLFAGSGNNSHVDGTGINASFSNIGGIAVNKLTGNVYVVSYKDPFFTLRQITPDGVVTTLSNTFSILTMQSLIVVDNLGNIFYTSYAKSIYKIPCLNNSATPTFGNAELFAGAAFITDNIDGSGAAARFRSIGHIEIDASNNLYVADSNLIRRITPSGDVTTIAGNINQTTSTDGIGLAASFSSYGVSGPAVYKFSYSQLDNSLYGTEGLGYESLIRKIDLTSMAVTTLYPVNVNNVVGVHRQMINGNIYGLVSGDPRPIKKTPIFGYSISPSLPSGLSLTATGQIVGTPTAISPLTTYTIKSVNPYHVVTTTTQIEVILPSQAPTASPQTFCSGATVSDLVATGTDLKWYSVAEGGVALNTATVLTGTTYYVSQTVSGTESTRTAVVVTITPTVGSIGSISGPVNLSSTATEATYSVTSVSGATSYVWSLPAGMTLTAQTGASITVAVSSTYTSGLLTVKALNSCGETLVRSLTVRKSATPASGIVYSVSGNPILCSNATATYTATVIAGGFYTWTVPAGVTILEGQGTNSITVSSGSGFTSGAIRSSCVVLGIPLQGSITVSGVAQPSVINGPANLCNLTTATYAVTNISGATYIWSVPSGMTISSGQGSSSITVTFGEGVSGTISVQAQTNCGLSTARSIVVNTTPVLGGISGVTRVCGAIEAQLDTNGNVISTNASNTYTYSVAAVPGVTSYTWTVPNFAEISTGQGTNSITVSYDLENFVSGSITVKAGSACGEGAVRSLAVSTVTGTITGPTLLCSLTTATYSIPSDLGTGFVWTLPQGMSITDGENTSSITVAINHPINFASTNQVRVQFTTGCGGTRTLSLNVNCSDYTNLKSEYCGITGVTPYQWIYANTVVGATGYEFRIYQEGTLITTLERTVPYFRFYGSNFAYGATYQVKVKAKQNGSYGVEGSACSVTIGNLPTISLQAAYCGITVNPYQWLFANAVTGATSYRFNVYQGSTLVTSIDRTVPYFRFDGNTFEYGATYEVKVQARQGAGDFGVEGKSCDVTIQANGTTREAEAVEEKEVTTTYSVLSAYPNPFTTAFTITPLEGETATLFYQVYDITGKMLESKSVEASEITNHTIGADYPVGMYLVIVRQGATTQTFKMIKQ